MFGNKVMQSISTTGTGTMSFNSTGVGSWKSWRSQFTTSGAEVFYYAEDEDGEDWEFGYGTLTHATPDTLTRNLILSSTGALIDWVAGHGTVYVQNVPFSQAMEGRWVSAKSMWVPKNRRPTTAVGAANKTIAAADVAGIFTLDNSAATRSVTLPALSAVGEGFSFRFMGLSQLTYLSLIPNGSEAIDHIAGGTTVKLPGLVCVDVWSDGSQWRTNFNYFADHTLIVLVPSAAASADFPGLPGWVNHIKCEPEITLSSDGADVLVQTYGADGVLDTGGSDYSYIYDTVNGTPTASPAAGSSSSFGLCNGGADNGSSAGILSRITATNIRRSTYTKFTFESFFENDANLTISSRASARRNEADLITGLKLTASAGTMTGTVPLLGRA